MVTGHKHFVDFCKW